MTRLHRTLLISLAPLALLACEGETGTHIGNPPVTSTGLGFLVAGDQSPSLTFADRDGLEFELTSASATVRDIELNLPDDTRCADVRESLAGGATCSNDKIRIEGPWLVDLVTGEADPSLERVRIPTLSYERADFRIEDDDDRVSFAARADFEYMQTPLELRLALRFNEDARLEAPGGVEPPEHGQLTLLLSVTDWLDGVPIGGCLDSGDLEAVGGVVLIADDDPPGGECDDVEDVIKDQIKESGQLRADD